MPSLESNIPLSLYIHLPWCIQKCPYCDFNSHALRGTIPETAYVNALLEELDDYLPWIAHRPLISIFFGGGTPSLFSPEAIGLLLERVAHRLTYSPTIEITLEANPGTAEQVRFHGYRAAGINRLSLGVQSLQDDKLKKLGRIHGSKEALRAIEMGRQAGFRLNVDLMFGLPDQTPEDAYHDLKKALDYQIAHLSWYQLTIEPNTIFYKRTPVLPAERVIAEIEETGKALIQSYGLEQYEVSAYAKAGEACAHNLNYWTFGDYIGIGAGAHSKLTLADTGEIIRFAQVKMPEEYLNVEKRRLLSRIFPTPLEPQRLPFEFMLNALRLTEGIEIALFNERTGLAGDSIAPYLNKAIARGLLQANPARIQPTALGKKYLNDLVGMFL
jgi:oxygen-independent coproporphyrinogen-3 oxidase